MDQNSLKITGNTRSTINTREHVVTVTSTVTGVTSGFTYTVPKRGIVVLTMRTR